MRGGNRTGCSEWVVWGGERKGMGFRAGGVGGIVCDVNRGGI